MPPVVAVEPPGECLALTGEAPNPPEAPDRLVVGVGGRVEALGEGTPPQFVAMRRPTGFLNP
jgi:hypothetical protein